MVPVTDAGSAGHSRRNLALGRQRKVRKSSGSLRQKESEKQIKVRDWGERTIYRMLDGVSGLNCGLIEGTSECPQRAHWIEFQNCECPLTLHRGGNRGVRKVK